MVLVIVSNSWQILDYFHSRFLQDLSAPNAGSFENEWCPVCSCGTDYKLSSPNGAWRCVACVQKFGIGQEPWIALVFHADSLFVFQEDPDDLLLNKGVQIWIWQKSQHALSQSS